MKRTLAVMVIVGMLTQVAAQLSPKTERNRRFSASLQESRRSSLSPQQDRNSSSLAQGNRTSSPPSQGGAGGGDEVYSTSQPTDTRPTVRFEAVDIYVDSAAEPLAAYQFELLADADRVKIVGVEGGEHTAFREPPYYDPAALSHHRIIIAAFNTGRDLPKGKTRVARLHVQVTGSEPHYQIKLDTAGSAEGKEIPATVSVETGATR